MRAGQLVRSRQAEREHKCFACGHGDSHVEKTGSAIYQPLHFHCTRRGCSCVVVKQA